MSCEQNLQIHIYNLHPLLKNLVSFVSDHPELMLFFVVCFLSFSLFPDLHKVWADLLCNKALLFFYPENFLLLFIWAFDSLQPLVHTRAMFIGFNSSIRPPVWSVFVLKGPLLCPWDRKRRASFPSASLCLSCARWALCVCSALLCANWTMLEPRWPNVANPRPP